MQVAEEQQNPSAAWFCFLRIPGAGEIVSRMTLISDPKNV